MKPSVGLISMLVWLSQGNILLSRLPVYYKMVLPSKGLMAGFKSASSIWCWSSFYDLGRTDSYAEMLAGQVSVGGL